MASRVSGIVKWLTLDSYERVILKASTIRQNDNHVYSMIRGSRLIILDKSSADNPE